MNIQKTVLLALWAAFILNACVMDEPGQSAKTPFGANKQQSKQNTFTSERIISSAQGDDISFSGLIEKLSQADYVLLGEHHDDPVHHQLQQRILNALIESGRAPSVVFEMFDREDAGLISSVSRRYPGEPDKIANAVHWETSGWPDWQMYRPIVKTAMDASLPVVAGNLSRWKAHRMLVEEIPPMNLKTATLMGLMASLPTNQEEKLREKIRQLHGDVAPPNMVSGMLAAQRVRDATLADSMISQNYGGGSVLIAGSEHTRTDYGVPFYLNHREPDARIASVAFIGAGEDIASSHSSEQTPGHPAYDFVWMLPTTDLNEVSTFHKVAHQKSAIKH